MTGKRGSRPAVAARWRERLGRWRKSGQSIAEFCRGEGVSQPSFYLWRRRLTDEAPVTVGGTGRAFLPVEIVGESPLAATGHECELLVGGLVCRVPRGLNDDALRRLIRLLREEDARC